MDALFLVIQHALQHFTLHLSTIHTYMSINRDIRRLILESLSYVSIAVDDTDMPLLPWAREKRLPICFIQLRKSTWDPRIPIDHRAIHIEIPYDRLLKDEHIIRCLSVKTLILPKNRYITDKGVYHMKNLSTINLNSNRHITDTGLIGKDLVHVSFMFNHKITDAAFAACKAIDTFCMGYSSQKKLTCRFLERHRPRQIIVYSKKLHDGSPVNSGR